MKFFAVSSILLDCTVTLKNEKPQLSNNTNYDHQLEPVIFKTLMLKTYVQNFLLVSLSYCTN